MPGGNEAYSVKAIIESSNVSDDDVDDASDDDEREWNDLSLTDKRPKYCVRMFGKLTDVSMYASLPPNTNHERCSRFLLLTQTVRS